MLSEALLRVNAVLISRPKGLRREDGGNLTQTLHEQSVIREHQPTASDLENGNTLGKLVGNYVEVLELLVSEETPAATERDSGHNRHGEGGVIVAELLLKSLEELISVFGGNHKELLRCRLWSETEETEQV